jgi:hypothetical protein
MFIFEPAEAFKSVQVVPEPVTVGEPLVAVTDPVEYGEKL